MKERARAYVLTVVLAGLVASPLVGAFERDSFPVSTYPMFASARPTEVSLPHAIVGHADGSERPAPPTAIANDEVIQALSTLRQALRQGPEATAALCERIASRVAGSDALLVRIVTSTYNPVGYYTGEREPIHRVEHVDCEVPQ
jgi:hypothetical protein